MKKTLVGICAFCTSLIASAQYTETINSNRPGGSQGAFAVGTEVLQIETGLKLGNDEHKLTHTDTDFWGIDYGIRYGFFKEQLEVSLLGSYLNTTVTNTKGITSEELKYSNFRSNTLGVKYLIYDPYKKRMFEKPNLYSWKANNRFKWRDLIPAVSLYAGANILFGDNQLMYYPYINDNLETKITPTAALITQNNWGRWVFVMNIIAEKIGDEYPTYAGIFTMTHAASAKVSIFAEYQTIKNDLYSDDIARFGGAYLFTKDLQVDLSGLVNFKDTPSRWQVALGFSYRIDMHKQDEMIKEGRKGKIEKASTKDKKEKKKKNNIPEPTE
ncbi:hypothetical protein GGR32_000379 [Mesonia hippocampi]|uniref:Outer membrane beta-barrel porin/alpha-amylase n=1 Tax=Mesonia hippocampi TaxID=1628250 RepID=A0A840ET59_9FLAO|nr:transporter [Mesonia hippocampi]MBB4118107.1 hypothetical protein [Mesonia hippocampi]